MTRRIFANLFRLILIGLMGASLSGCWLRMILGNVIVVHDIPGEVDTVLATVFSHASATVCNVESPVSDCTYIIEGEIITSSAYIIAEGGVLGGLFNRSSWRCRLA